MEGWQGEEVMDSITFHAFVDEMLKIGAPALSGTMPIAGTMIRKMIPGVAPKVRTGLGTVANLKPYTPPVGK